MSENLWLDDGPVSRPTPSRRRRTGRIAAATLCLVVVGVPVALVASGRTGVHSAGAPPSRTGHVGRRTAASHLLTALNATTGSGNFDVTYSFGGQAPGPAPAPTTGCAPTGPPAAPSSGGASLAGSPTTDCPGPGPFTGLPLGGTATIDVQPFAMVATSQVPGLGTIVLRDNGTDVWEEGGGNYGLTPGNGGSGPGSSLTGFASLVEGTLGPRQGALAMLGLASPTGYLNLDPAETSSASLVGTGTVAGVPVDVYQLSLTPGQGGQVAGLTAQEQQAVAGAMQVLGAQGFTGSTVRVSVDAAGFIRRTQTTDHFSDGTTMTSEAQFSNFGCAGTVLMPGQSGPSAPPAGCTSPDDPAPPAPPTTGTGPATTAPPTTGPPGTTSPPPGPMVTVPSTTPAAVP